MTIEELKVVITAEIDDLKQSMRQVKDSVNGVSGNIIKQTKKVTTTVKSSIKSLTSSFKSLGSVIAGAISTVALLKVGADAIQVASDLEEAQNVVNVAFGEMAAQAEFFAKKCANAFGLSELSAKQTSSTFMAMAKGMDVNAQAAKTMSLQLTALSGDMASFYNVNQDVANTALKSVFTGETESLKKFGIVMTEANLEAYRLAKGIKVSYSEMSQAQKVALRYNYVMNATAQAQGDFARTSNSWANQLRLLRLMWEDLMVAMGTIFTHVLLPIMKALNVILAQIVRIAQGFASMFRSESPVQEIENLSGGFGGLSDSIDDASESAKKYKKLITGFDELNILSSTGGGTGLDMSGAGFDMELEQPYDFNKLAQDTTEVKKTLQEVIDSFNDFNIRLGEKLVASRTAVSEWGKNLAGGINSVVDGVQWDSIGSNIGNGLNLIIDFFKNFWVELDGYDIGVAIATMLNNTISTVDWQGLTDTIVARFNTIIAGLAGFVENFDGATLVGNLTTLFQGLIRDVNWVELSETIAVMFNGMIEGVGQLIEDIPLDYLVDTIFTSVATTISQVKWGELGKTIHDFIISIFSGLASSNLLEEIGNAFRELLSGLDIRELASQFCDMAQELFKDVFAGIFGGESLFTNVLGDVAGILTTYGPIISGIATAAAALNLSGIYSLISGLVGLLKSGLGSLISWGVQLLLAKQAVGGSAETISNLSLGIKGVITQFKDGSVQAFKWKDVLVGVFTGVKNAVVSAVTFIISNPIALIIAAVVALVASIAVWGDQIQEALNKLTDWITNIFVRDWTEVFGGTLGSVLNGFVAVLEDVWEGAKNILNGIIDFIRGVFTGDWERAWKGIQEIFAGVFQALVGVAKMPLNLIIGLINGMLNAIASGINFVIKAINKIKFSIPDWVPVIGGKSFNGFNIKTVTPPQIPQLANGGVAYESTLANIGEYAGAKHNPEIVAPQNLLEAIVNKGNEDIVSALAQMTNQLISAIGDVDMSVSIGDNVIAQSAARGNQAYKRRTGVALI